MFEASLKDKITTIRCNQKEFTRAIKEPLEQKLGWKIAFIWIMP